MVHPELRVRGACTHTHPYVAIHMLAYCSINLCVWLYSDEGYQYIDMFEEDGMYNVYLCIIICTSGCVGVLCLGCL